MGWACRDGRAGQATYTPRCASITDVDNADCLSMRAARCSLSCASDPDTNVCNEARSLAKRRLSASAAATAPDTADEGR
jgi:hypothetical protein